MSSYSFGDAEAWTIVPFEELAAICNRACDTVTSWSAVTDEFINLARGSIGQQRLDAILKVTNNQLGSIAIAFQYDLKSRSEERIDLREAFSPMAEFSDGTQIPPQISRLPDDVVTIWMSIARFLNHPGAISRINDLLFCRGIPDAGFCARTAIDGYVNLVSSNWTTLEMTHALLRALVLARGTRDKSRTAQVISTTEQHYWSSIRASAPPGITMPLIEALLDSDYPDTQLDEMISAARDLYQEPHLADQLIFWQLRRSKSPEQRKNYIRERVMLWLNAAATADPMVRVLYLETAAGYVDDLDDQDLKQEVRVLLQSSGREDLGLKSVPSGVTIPREEVDRYVSQFATADNWQRCT